MECEAMDAVCLSTRLVYRIASPVSRVNRLLRHLSTLPFSLRPSPLLSSGPKGERREGEGIE